MALADELGLRPLVAHCHQGLGKLYRCTGDSAKAAEHLITASARWTWGSGWRRRTRRVRAVSAIHALHERE
jgi:hypothetical protein